MIKKRAYLMMLFLVFLIPNATAFALKAPIYKLDCKLDTQNHTLEATQELTFTNNYNQETDRLYFHIYPNRSYTKKEKNFLIRYAGYFKINPFPEGFQSGNLNITSLKGPNKQNLSYSIEGEEESILRIDLPKKLKRGDSIKIRLDFTVSIPHSYGRFGWHSQNENEIIALHRFYPILCMFDEEGWHTYPNYLYHQPFFSEASMYKVNLTLPENYVVAHSGRLEKREETENTQILTIDSDFPIRDFTLAVGSKYEVASGEFQGIKINSFYLKGDEFYGQKGLEFAAELISYYTEQFGPYPYKEFSIAPVYLVSGGYESSNIIFIDTRVYKLPRFLLRYFEFLICHETGHQWFFNMVGSDEFKETWLDEGFNSYWLNEYFEQKYGPDAEVLALPKYVDWFIPNVTFKDSRTYRYFFLQKNGWDRPILGELSSFREPSSIFALSYGKGSAVLEMLEYLLGGEVFGKIMRRYFKEFKFKNASVESFKNLCEQESARELDWFFDDWLKTTKICDYGIKKVTREKLVLERKGQIAMPVQTKLYFNDGSTQSLNWDGKEEEKEFSLDTSREIKKVEIDPDKKLLDVDRVNNVSYPSPFDYNINFKPVPLYMFLYEIPLFLEDNSYNFVFGPDVSTNGLGLKGSLQRPYDNIMYGLSNYDISENQFNSTVGYQIKHIFNSPLVLGFELFDRNNLDDDTEDLQGGKVYLRRELWPASYGLTQVNDHITAYFVHNRKFEGISSGALLEDVENLLYRKAKESIFGLQIDFNRSGPYPDPTIGWRISINQEVAGHFLHGNEAFWRLSSEFVKYQKLFENQRLVLRFKWGIGGPSDKTLYQLGSDEGLRGYDRKEIEGRDMLLASVEYRIDLLKNLNIRLLDNLIGFSGLGAVAFFDTGKAWYKDFDATDVKQDVGFGFRIPVNIGGFLEKMLLRIDVAKALGESKEDAHVWFGINHAF